MNKQRIKFKSDLTKIAEEVSNVLMSGDPNEFAKSIEFIFSRYHIELNTNRILYLTGRHKYSNLHFTMEINRIHDDFVFDIVIIN